MESLLKAGGSMSVEDYGKVAFIKQACAGCDQAEEGHDHVIKFWGETVDTQPALGGKKNDQGKPMMALLTPEFLEETAKVLTVGQIKYSAWNWAKGMAWSRPFGALMRHAWAWWGGQDTDPESGLSHLAHCLANIMFLLHYQKFGRGEDDRYKI